MPHLLLAQVGRFPNNCQKYTIIQLCCIRKFSGSRGMNVMNSGLHNLAINGPEYSKATTDSCAFPKEQLGHNAIIYISLLQYEFPISTSPHSHFLRLSIASVQSRQPSMVILCT